MNTLKLSAVTLAITLTILAIVYMFVSNMQIAVGSTIQGNDYESMSFALSDAYGASTTEGVLKSRGGSLGSVIITGAATGIISFYDATTTDITKRAASLSTSTILIASLPASLAAGTYTFDTTFGTALYIDILGNVPTSTVTWR